MKFSFPTSLFLLLCHLHVAAQTPACGCGNCSSFLADGGTTTHTIYVNDANYLLGENGFNLCGVNLHFKHEYLGDLNIDLISPAGTSVRLVGPSGFFISTDSSDWQVTFVPCTAVAQPDPGFASTWNNNQAWGWGLNLLYTGSYYPASGCLEDFSGESANGTWTLKIADTQAQDVGYLYDFNLLFCGDTVFTCAPLPPLALTVSGQEGCEPLSVGYQTELDSTLFVNLNWQFPGGAPATSGLDSVAVVYSNSGVYPVILTAYTAAGDSVVTTQTHEFVVHPLPEAAFEVAVINGEVLLNNTGTGDSVQFFLNGVPFIAPQWLDSLGVSTVTQIAFNGCGSDTTEQLVHFQDFPRAEFSWTANNLTVQFNNQSSNTDTYFWQIPALGFSSGEANPVVIFPDTGSYNIRLACINNLKTVYRQQVVTLEATSASTVLHTGALALTAAPNPNHGAFTLSTNNLPDTRTYPLQLFNAVGQLLKTTTFTPPATSYNWPDLPPGHYLAQIRTPNGALLHLKLSVQ